MKISSIVTVTLGLIAFLGLLSTPYAQTSKPALDSAVTEGVLPNGIRYLIRPTKTGGANIQLIVNVGSLDEADDEQGYAHFVEHLAFRKTRRTRDGEIISFVTGLGGTFGQHVNGFTYLNKTQYSLSLPLDKISFLPNAIKVVADWTNGIEFSDDIIDIERGVVLSEKRLRDQSGLPAETINQALLDRGLFKRPIIGIGATLASANAAKLNAFYRKHYTPERMTIVLTGWLPDGPAFWARKLSDELGQVGTSKSTAVLPQRPNFQTSKQVRVVQADNAARNSIGILSYSAQSAPRNADQLRQLHLRSIARQMLSQYLVSTLNSPAWILNSRTADLAITSDMRYFEVALEIQDLKFVDEARDLLLKSIAGFVTNGIRQGFIDRVKGNLIASLKTIETESERYDPTSVGFQLANYVDSDGIYVSASNFRTLSEAVLASVTPEDIADQIKQRFASEDLLWVVLSQRGTNKPQVNESILKEKSDAWLIELKAATPLVRTTGNAIAAIRPVNTLPPPKPEGTIVKEEDQADGVKRWTLSNGATVYLKPVTASVDQVLITAHRQFGLWNFDQSDIPASRIARRSGWFSDGIGLFATADLRQELQSRSLNMDIGLDSTRTIVALAGPSIGLEFGSHLLHEFFSNMRPSGDTFNRMKARLENDLTLANPTPQQRFEREWTLGLIGPNPWLNPLTSAQVNQTNPVQLQLLHQQMFADASQWVFTFTGNISTRDVRRLTQTYIASLTGDKSNLSLQTRLISVPSFKQGVRVEAKGALAGRTVLRVQYFNPEIKRDLFQDAIARQIQVALRERLLLVLRSSSGLTYAPSAIANLQFDREKGAVISVDVDIATQDLERVESLIKGTIQSLVTVPLSDSEYAVLVQVEKVATNNNRSDYVWVANTLQLAHRLGETLESHSQARAKVAALDAKGLQSEFKKWIENVVPSVGVLRPD